MTIIPSGGLHTVLTAEGRIVHGWIAGPESTHYRTDLTARGELVHVVDVTTRTRELRYDEEGRPVVRFDGLSRFAIPVAETVDDHHEEVYPCTSACIVEGCPHPVPTRYVLCRSCWSWLQFHSWLRRALHPRGWPDSAERPSDPALLLRVRLEISREQREAGIVPQERAVTIQRELLEVLGGPRGEPADEHDIDQYDQELGRPGAQLDESRAVKRHPEVTNE